MRQPLDIDVKITTAKYVRLNLITIHSEREITIIKFR